MSHDTNFNNGNLLNRLSDGDKSAYNQIYDQFAPKIYANALKFTKSPEAAKDLTQEVFLKIWSNRSKMVKVERLDAFIFVMARNIIFNSLKKQLPVNAPSEYLENFFEFHERSVDEIAETRELENHLNIAIEKLPQQMKTAFKLSRFEGMTHEQIAGYMNISPTTSKSYIVRALQSIRQYLSEQGLSVLFIMMLLADDSDIPGWFN